MRVYIKITSCYGNRQPKINGREEQIFLNLEESLMMGRQPPNEEL